ncbi:MAG: 4-hydroxy-tetrahydrodipicolinate synthase [Marinilabiliales bacterium]|nr:MAG: 4-hydroxy-tetrahydrodipicolinate synthase [Marinilabiliales bacterium]
MSKKLFQGTGVAVVTPFRDDESVDFPSMGKVIEHLIEGKVEYIVALGTTGESVTLNQDEKTAVINFVIEKVNNRIPVVMGVGGNNTHEVVSAVQSVCDENLPLAGILSVSPYYNKPTQEGIYLHYKKVATASTLPVIIYNVPGRTGQNITAETTVRLARDCRNIVATKEASGDLNQVNYILKNKPKDFMVISGDDQLTLPMIALGASGVISVSANAFPFELSEMVRLALKGKLRKAQAYQNALLDLMNAHFVEGNPAGVKASLNIRKLIHNNLRLPLCKVSTQTYNKIRSLIEELDGIKESLYAG